MEREAVNAFLAKHPYFRHVPLQDRERLLRQAHLRPLEEGEILALEGDPCTAVYVVLRGRVHALKTSAEGREQIVTSLLVGQVLYAVPALDGLPLPATAQAATHSVVLAIPRQAFLDALRTCPDMAMAVLRDFAGRLRQLTALVEDLALRSVAGRLARLLYERASQPGSPRMTQREMAAHLGTVREVVARTLAQFERQGWIRLGRGVIEILDAEALRKAADL